MAPKKIMILARDSPKFRFSLRHLVLIHVSMRLLYLIHFRLVLDILGFSVVC